MNVIVRCGCFTGDTIINYDVNGGVPHEAPIERLYRRLHGDLAASYPIPDGAEITVRGKKVERVGRNKIIDVVCQGVQKVIKLTFEDGRTVRCTPDHLFWTGGSWVKAESMLGENGMLDPVKPHVGYRQEKKSDPRVAVPDVHPYARTQTRANGGYSNIIELHRAMFECYANGFENLDDWRANMSDNSFYVDPSRYVVHHIDGNHYNNSKDNLCLLTDSGHKLIHSGGENGLAVPTPLLCVSIEDAGEETTYDIMCETYNSYTANGLVAHNCGGIQNYIKSSMDILKLATPSAEYVGKDKIRKLAEQYPGTPLAQHLGVVAKKSGRYAYYISTNDANEIVAMYNLIKGQKVY